MPQKKSVNDNSDTGKLTLLLNVVRQCNLKCIYCYEPHDGFDEQQMECETAQRLITRYMTREDGHDSVEIQFFGGEPMLAFPLIKNVVEWFLQKEWGKKYIFYICSNGTILTAEMKNWLSKHHKYVVLGYSIDGNKIAHDLGRSNSYDLVRRNLPFITEHWPTQPGKITICAETIPYVAEGIIELEELGLNFTANIVFEDIWGDEERKNKLLEKYREQLLLLVDYYAERPHLEPVGPILTRDLEFIGIKKENKPEWKQVRYCGAGHDMVMADVDGTVYPCHRFTDWIAKRDAPQTHVNRQQTWKPEKCAECDYVTACPTCAGYNWEVNGDSGVRTTHHCEAFKLELPASAKLQAIRLGKQLPQEILNKPGREASRVKVQVNAILKFIGNGV